MSAVVERIRLDSRYAWRLLERSPGFAFLAALTLALGIGVNTAVFSLIDALLLRPLPVGNPESLVALYSFTEGESNYQDVSYPDFLDFKESGALAGLAAHQRMPFSVVAEGVSERIWGEAVSGDYFDVLRVALPLGRGFRLEEDRRSDSAPVAVIGRDFWLRRFGGDPSILGKSIRVNGRLFSIIGVAPIGFRGVELELGVGSPAEIWIPFGNLNHIGPIWHSQLLDSRAVRWLGAVGRLLPERTREQAERALATRAYQLGLEYPENRGVTVKLLPSREAQFSPGARSSVVSFLMILSSVAALVLLIACSNVATLLLARGSARQRELAIRSALGSSRRGLVGQLLVESSLLYLAGGAISIPVAFWTMKLIASYQLPFQVPLRIDMRLDLRVLAFALLATFLTSVGFGLLPALRASRTDLRAAFQGDTRWPAAGAAGFARYRALLVGFQVAVSALLLVAAGVFLRTLQRSLAIEPGFEPRHVLMLSVDFNSNQFSYDDRRAMSFYRQALERVRGLPGVEAATWAGDVPLGIRRILIWFVPDDRLVVGDREWIQLACDVVGPDYFRTLGIPLLRGHDFGWQDDDSRPEVVVVNETLARKYWPGQDPVGKRLKVRGRSGVRQVEVIGLARDVRQRSLWQEPQPFIYLHLFQRYFPEMTLQVRVSGEPAAFADAVKQELAALDKDLPLFGVRSLQEQVEAALSQQRMAATLLSLAGVLALVLSAVGVYAVTTCNVAERTREIGIRMALGAEPSAVRRLVVGQPAASAICGLVLGLIASVPLARYADAVILGVTAAEPWAFAAGAFLLGAAACVAAYLPAARATRVDPVLVLRQEG